MSDLEQPIVHVDIEAKALTYLRGWPGLSAVRGWGTELPSNLDTRLPFVMLTRIPSGPQDTLFDLARVDVEVRAASRETGHDTIQLVMAYLRIMNRYPHSGAIVYGVEVESGPGWNPDPLTNQPRWIATVSIRNRPN